MNSTQHAPITGPARPAIEARFIAEGSATPNSAINPYPPGSAAATWWQQGHDFAIANATGQKGASHE